MRCGAMRVTSSCSSADRVCLWSPSIAVSFCCGSIVLLLPLCSLLCECGCAAPVPLRRAEHSAAEPSTAQTAAHAHDEQQHGQTTHTTATAETKGVDRPCTLPTPLLCSLSACALSSAAPLSLCSLRSVFSCALVLGRLERPRQLLSSSLLPPLASSRPRPPSAPLHRDVRCCLLLVLILPLLSRSLPQVERVQVDRFRCCSDGWHRR